VALFANAPAPEVNELRSEAQALQELVAEFTRQNHLLKKVSSGMENRSMIYPASKKLETISAVEASHLCVKHTLAVISIPCSAYYDRYAR
jgi:hypothetical protein